MRWKVGVSLVLCVLKVATTTVKMPYALVGSGQNLVLAGGFALLTGTGGILGAWSLPRIAQLSPTVAPWLVHLSGILSHILGVVMPTSVLPIVAGTLADPAFLGTALLEGCRETLSAAEEEVAAWRQTFTLGGALGVAFAPMLATLASADIDPINYACLFVDVAITPMLFFLPMAVPPQPSKWSWSRILSLKSLWTAPGLWMMSWSFAQAVEHHMTEKLVWVLWVETFAPVTPFFGSMVAFCYTLAGMANVTYLQGPAMRASQEAVQMLLLGTGIGLGLIRWAGASASSTLFVCLISYVGQVCVYLMGWAKWGMCQQCAAKDEEEEAEGMYVLQELINSAALVVAPFTLMKLGWSYHPQTIVEAWPPISLGILIAGQVGLALLCFSSKSKTKAA